MKTYENTTEDLNVDNFLGNFLTKESIDGEAIVTLTGVHSEHVKGRTRPKLVAKFAEFEKPLVLNSTNIKRLRDSIFRSKNAATWRGEVVLYVDESVEYGGDVVGGIRIKASNN